MRAIKKLERRFKRAFANLEADAGGDAGAATSAYESINLSKQITTLEADISEKDAKLETLTAQMADLAKQGTDATTKNTALEVAAKSAADDAAKFQAAVEKAKASDAASATQIQSLEESLKAAEARGQEAAARSETITGLEAELSALKAKLEETEARSENYFDRMRKLRGSLRIMRTGLKNNVLNAEDMNTVMQAELDALQTQRELDLKEVNVVLEKLTPLVEGK